MTPDELRQPVSQLLTEVDSTLDANLTVAETIESLRSRKINHHIVYFYVLDHHESDIEDDNGQNDEDDQETSPSTTSKENSEDKLEKKQAPQKLVGIVSTRQLLLGNASQKIADIMIKDIVTLHQEDPLERAIELFSKHRLLALPVVDDQQQLKGAVDIKVYSKESGDAIEAVRQADLFQLMGLRLESARDATLKRALRLRMPWLMCNLTGGLICAAIAWLMEDVIQAVVTLALFIPMVLTLAESIAMQSMTLSLPLVHGKTVDWKALGRRLQGEWPTALILGLIFGILVAATGIGFTAGSVGEEAHADSLLGPAAVLLVSVPAAMLTAALLGMIVPTLLHTIRLDPKIAAGPLVLMATDIVATTVYLGLGTLWLL